MRFEIKNWVAINISEYKTKLLLHNIFLFYLNEEQKKKKEKNRKNTKSRKSNICECQLHLQTTREHFTAVCYKPVYPPLNTFAPFLL